MPRDVLNSFAQNQPSSIRAQVPIMVQNYMQWSLAHL